MANDFNAVGRRKSAVARVRLVPGEGKILVNKRDIDDYFGLETLKMTIRQPMNLVNVGGSFEMTFTHHTLFVKRLIALPGDILEIKEGAVYVNGELVDESGINKHSQSSESTIVPIVLGEDDYFVMGDNRANSNDSRRVGPITRDMIVGRVERTILPLGKFWDKVE